MCLRNEPSLKARLNKPTIPLGNCPLHDKFLTRLVWFQLTLQADGHKWVNIVSHDEPFLVHHLHGHNNLGHNDQQVT